MYEIREGMKEIFKEFKVKYYSENTGLTTVYLSQVLNGMAAREVTVRVLIGIRFEMRINDERMPEMIEKYFKKVVK